MEARHFKGKLYLSVLIFLVLLNFTVAESRSHVPARILARQTGATQFEEERYETHADCNDHKHHLKKRASDEDVDYEVYQGVVGRPGIDFPIYPRIPKTTFSCRSYGNGYFADMETDCQVFHICEEGRKISFLCPNGTIFQQSELTCDWWFKVNCLGSSGFYADSTELLNKQRVQRLKPSIPVQGFNIVGGGLNIKPRATAKTTPRSRVGPSVASSGNKSERRIDSAEAPSIESVDFDDLSGEKAVKNPLKPEITTIDNNDNDEVQIPAESASFVTSRNRNSYNNEKPKVEPKPLEAPKASSLKTDDGTRRGAGDRGSQRRGYGGLNNDNVDKSRGNQRGNQRFRDDKKPEGDAKGSVRTDKSEEKPFKKDKFVENAEKSNPSTPSYASGTYTTARKLDSTRTTPFYTPTVPSVAKSKTTEGKSNYGSSKGGSPTTPTPHRFSIGNVNGGTFLETSGGGSASGSVFSSGSGSLSGSITVSKPTVAPSDSDYLATTTNKQIIFGMRRQNNDNNDRSSEFSLPSNHKSFESAEVDSTTPASTGPTYLPKSAVKPKTTNGFNGDSLLFAPITVIQEDVNRNVHDMIKTINVLQHNFEDVELVKVNGNGNGNGNGGGSGSPRVGLDIPASSGPDALFSLAKYFATEEPTSANKNVNSVEDLNGKKSLDTKGGKGSGGSAGNGGFGLNGSSGNGLGGNGLGGNGSGFGGTGSAGSGTGGNGSNGKGSGSSGSGFGPNGSAGFSSGSNGSSGKGSGASGSGFGPNGSAGPSSGGNGSSGKGFNGIGSGFGPNGSAGNGSGRNGSGGNGSGGNGSDGNGSGGNGSGFGGNTSGGFGAGGNDKGSEGFGAGGNGNASGIKGSGGNGSGAGGSITIYPSNSNAPREKPSDTTATLTTESPAAVAHNADQISSSLLSNNTVSKYNNLFGLNAPSNSDSSNRNGLADTNAPKSKDVNTPFPQIGATDATIQALAEKPESRKIAQVFSNALNDYLNDPVKFRDELVAVRPTEPPLDKKITFVSVTDPTLFNHGTAATYLPTAPPVTGRPLSTTHSNIASVINSNLITSTGYPDYSSTTEVFDVTTFKQSSGERKSSLEFSGELEPPGADSGEELLQREHTQSFVNSHNGLIKNKDKSGKLSTDPKPEKPWSFTEDDGVLDPLKINDGLMKKHQASSTTTTTTTKKTTPSPVAFLTGETTTNVPKNQVQSQKSNTKDYQTRDNSQGRQNNERYRSETDDPWADIFDSYDLPKESLPTNSGLQRIANKLFGGLNENEALHLKNVMAEAEHNRQILRLLLLLIQTCDDNNGKALERSRKSLLNALISMDSKVTKDSSNGKNAHVKTKPVTTTEKFPVTTYRRNGSGEEFTTSTLQYPSTTTDVPSTTVYGSTTDANSSGETTKFAIIVDDEENSTTTAATTSAGSGGGGQLDGNSDKRALELLKSLYSLASKFTSRR